MDTSGHFCAKNFLTQIGGGDGPELEITIKIRMKIKIKAEARILLGTG